MGFQYKGNPLALDTQWSDENGTQYPASWLRTSTATQRANVPGGGVTHTPEPAWYDTRFATAAGVFRDVAEIKSEWIAKQKNQANSLLSKTDWLVIRAAEGGTAVPSNQATYRAGVRTQSKAREDQITACTTTAEVQTLINTTSTASTGLKPWPTPV